MDLEKYIDNRLENEHLSKEKFWDGYENFKIGFLFKEERIKIGITQQELALRTNTSKSTISRIENHAEDIKLATLEKVSKALGRKIKISLV